MKKILLFFVGFAFIVSCSSDDSNSVPPENKVDIIGKWLIVGYSDSEIKDISEILKVEPCAAKTEVVFNSNLTYVETSYSGKDCVESEISTINYEINGDVLITVNKGGGITMGTDSVIKYYIKELTDSKLVIQGFYIHNGGNVEQPEIPEDKYYTMTYKRIK